MVSFANTCTLSAVLQYFNMKNKICQKMKMCYDQKQDGIKKYQKAIIVQYYADCSSLQMITDNVKYNVYGYYVLHI